MRNGSSATPHHASARLPCSRLLAALAKARGMAMLTMDVDFSNTDLEQVNLT